MSLKLEDTTAVTAVGGVTRMLYKGQQRDASESAWAGRRLLPASLAAAAAA